MAKRALSQRDAVKLTKFGYHPVDRNLYLQIKPNGARSWIFRYMRDGKVKDVGLGALRDFKVSEARAMADEARGRLKRGLEPFPEREEARRAKRLKQAAEIPTFKEACSRYIAAHEDSWTNDKSSQQWTQTLRDYAEPVIGKKLVSEIDVNDIFRILEPIWTTKTSTATKLRSRIEAVLNWAEAHEFRSGPNPARWRDGPLFHMLPSPSKIHTPEHHPAIPYRELPEFMADLRGREGVAGDALQFLILTAARTGEVREATWDEFDLDERVWIQPAHRIKNRRRDHRVPLSDAAVAILKRQPRDGRYVFAGQTPAKPLAKNAVAVLMGKIHPSATAHGMRSAFRDWAAENTAYSPDAVEKAMAHKVGSATERAYYRTDLLDQRRQLMDDWSGYLGGEG